MPQVGKAQKVGVLCFRWHYTNDKG